MHFLQCRLVAWSMVQTQRTRRCRALCERQRIDRAVDQYWRSGERSVRVAVCIAAKHAIAFGKCLIYSNVVLILHLDSQVVHSEVISIARKIRLRKYGQEIIRDGIDPVRRNHVSCKLLSRVGRGVISARVVNRSHPAEVTAAHRVCRLGQHGGACSVHTQPLVVAKEECLVLPDRAAERAAELILLELRLRGIEELPRIERVVAKELECRTMKVVSAGTCNHVHHRAAARKFSTVVADLHLEFPDALEIRKYFHSANRLVPVVQPIDHERVEAAS